MRKASRSFRAAAVPAPSRNFPLDLTAPGVQDMFAISAETRLYAWSVRCALRVPSPRRGGSSYATAVAIPNARAAMARRCAWVSGSNAAISTLLGVDNDAVHVHANRFASPIGRPHCYDDAEQRWRGNPETSNRERERALRCGGDGKHAVWRASPFCWGLISR